MAAEHQSANRRVFYDFTFSPPKSVSIAALVGHDPRIVEAHEQAVTAALSQLESFAATRVRKNGQCTARTTGNIVAAVFRHETSRALDPHLHSHCILFNATHDPVENQWKALENYEMLVAIKFIEGLYYHELARALRRFGYEIDNKPRGDFEIKGIAPSLIEKFSKRHQEIDQKTRELLEREPQKANGNIAAIRENIAHKERARKIRNISLPELQATWDAQLTQEEKTSLRHLTTGQTAPTISSETLAKQAVSWAEEHLLERRSVVHEHELWRHALEHVRGQSIGLADVQAVTRQRGYLRDEKHPGKVTTKELLRTGMGHCVHGERRHWPVRPVLLQPCRSRMQTWTPSNVKPSSESCGRAILSPCFAAGPARARVTRCVKCTALFNKPGARSRSSPRNGNRSWTWKRTAFVVRRLSVAFWRAESSPEAAWYWSMKPDRSVVGKCTNSCAWRKPTKAG